MNKMLWLFVMGEFTFYVCTVFTHVPILLTSESFVFLPIYVSLHYTSLLVGPVQIQPCPPPGKMPGCSKCLKDTHDAGVFFPKYPNLDFTLVASRIKLFNVYETISKQFYPVLLLNAYLLLLVGDRLPVK